MMKTLVLGLGNELLGDDGVGILAARAIKNEARPMADVYECNLAGMALLDVLAGYKYAIIVDAICTGRNEVGAILQMKPEDLISFPCVSPHYAGLPDVITIARYLGFKFPDQIVILAIEIEKPLEIGKGLSAPIARSLGALNSVIKKHLYQWSEEPSCD